MAYPVKKFTAGGVVLPVPMNVGYKTVTPAEKLRAATRTVPPFVSPIPQQHRNALKHTRTPQL